MHTVTRFRSPARVIMPMMFAAMVSAFIGGAAIGTLAMPRPAPAEGCNSTSDPIACLIAEAEAEDPPPR